MSAPSRTSATLKLADGLSLPLAVVTEKLAWLGRTGSGKTYGAMKAAELMLEAGAQVGRTLGLADYPSRGQVAATSHLFL